MAEPGAGAVPEAGLLYPHPARPPTTPLLAPHIPTPVSVSSHPAPPAIEALLSGTIVAVRGIDPRGASRVEPRPGSLLRRASKNTPGRLDMVQINVEPRQASRQSLFDVQGMNHHTAHLSESAASELLVGAA